MKIAACCITYKRPRLLGQLIECFNRQTYDDRELLILDDSGQYPNQPSGDRWRIVSIDRRFRTMGEKRNAAAALTSPDVDAFAVWDDDDVYLPWALEASVHALKQAPWAQSRHILEWLPDSSGWMLGETFSRTMPLREPRNICYHGSWSYTREAFVHVNGYPPAIDEDWRLAKKLSAAYGVSADTICPEYPHPFYAYSRHTSGQFHMSEMGANDNAYEFAAGQPVEQVTMLEIGWPRDFTSIPMPTEPQVRPW